MRAELQAEQSPYSPGGSPRARLWPGQGRGRPLTGLRRVAIGRVRLDVDVLHARDAAAQDGAHGARRAGPGLDAGGGGVLTRTWPEPDHTDAHPQPRAPWPPSSHPRLGPGPDATAALRPPARGHSGNEVPAPPRAPGCGARSPPRTTFPRMLFARTWWTGWLTSAPGQTKWT